MATSIGMITCSSIADQVKSTLQTRKDYRLYQLVPSCMFTISPELIKHVFEQSCLENDRTLLIYGFCHSEIEHILKHYSNQITKIKGGNCWEMLLGKEKTQEYISEGYWLLKDALCTKWKNEVFVSYGAFSEDSNMIKACGTKKILACRFESEKPHESDVATFASAFNVPYEITNVDMTSFRSLINKSIDELQGGAQPNPQRNSPTNKLQSMFKGVYEKEVFYKINVVTKDITFVSPRIRSLLGYTTDEFIQSFLAGPGNGYYKDSQVYQSVTESRYSYISKCLAQGIQLPYSVEYESLKKNGDSIWIRESLYPKYYKDGSIQPSLIGKLEDITDWKKNEEELKKALRKEVDLRAALEKEIKRRIHFTNALVHELKTPLTPIILASDTLANIVEEPNYQLLLEQIKIGANELCFRIDELLDLARGEVGLLTLDTEEMNINEVIKEVTAFLTSKATNNQQSITTQLSPDTPLILADRRRIKEVITNLVDNAIKYSGVNTTITIVTDVRKDDIVTTVRDTGKGIPKSNQNNIFDPYKRAPNNRLSGLGLGLALSKMIIEKHGGRIWLNGRYQKGCSFQFSIPVNSRQGATK
ncbi:ATP-binding protein [Dehalogenimonas sp. THU2]|uniref:ATP-binding protein n=1 Tax=Dehalogenimonas sp. THU2 TaxID=3151121 RepID=UPI003218BD92